MAQRLLLLFLTLPLLAAGCVSTQKRYEKGIGLEAQGRYAEAARYYVKVLEKEPDWSDARERLEAVGGRAIDRFLEEAEAAEEEGRYEAADDALRRLDRLRTDAEAVRVPLPMPSGYAAYRTSVTDAALADVRRRAEEAEREGDWAEALEAYERAERRYAMPEAQAAALVRRRADVLVRWAEQELERERYRAAFDRAQQALDLAGPESPEAQMARRLQEEAVAAGTRYVAWLPVAVASSVADSGSADLLQDLDGLLPDTYEEQASPFLAQTDPFRLRRALHRAGFDGRPLPPRQAAAIGRELGADLVVSVELVAFEREETVESEWTRPARFHVQGRGPTSGRRLASDTTYTEQRVDVALDAEIAYRIVDVRTRRVVGEGNAEADVEGALRRGRFDGDWRRLDLSDAERDLFREEAWREGLADVEIELADELVRRLADDLYESLLERIE